MSISQASAIFVVLLTDILLHGDWVHKDTVLEVDRSLRNDWKGSGMCRDATEAEIAEARDEQGAAELIGDDLRDLARQKGDLEDEIAVLQERKAELAGDLKALESDLEDLGKQRDTLQGAVDDLAGKQKELDAEVVGLEARKAAAEKPAAAAKSK